LWLWLLVWLVLICREKNNVGWWLVLIWYERKVMLLVASRT